MNSSGAAITSPQTSIRVSRAATADFLVFIGRTSFPS